MNVHLRMLLPREPMSKLGLCCRPVSVCPSVTFVSRWLKYRQTSYRPGIPIILVFLTPGADTQFQWELLQRRCKIYGGWKNFAIFDWNRRLFRKLYKIGPWLLWNVNTKSKMTDRSVSVPMTLSGLERRDARGQIIQADLLLPLDLERQNSAG